MNKYKSISIVLGFALLVALIRLFIPQTSTTVDKQSIVFDNILQRKSVRDYTSEPLRREQLDSLVRLGMAAPSANDMRPWQFYIVDDPVLLQALSKVQPYATPVGKAPAAIVVCGDTTVTDDKGCVSPFWMEDASSATQNILLGAEAMGLGAVWTAGWPVENIVVDVREILKMPEGLIPLAIIALGHPKDTLPAKDKWDIDLVHYNDKW